MKKLLVLYYSRSGNTKKMTRAVAEGAKSVNGIEVNVNLHVEAPELLNYNAIIFGAPTYHKEIPIDFKNLFESLETQNLNLKGKFAAAFGSYGWSGEAPKMILDLLKEKFQMQTLQPPVLAKYIPDSAALDASKELGRKISETLMNIAQYYTF